MWFFVIYVLDLNYYIVGVGFLRVWFCIRIVSGKCKEVVVFFSFLV